MDHATQVALTRRIFAFMSAGTTEMGPAPYINEVSTYTSASQLERERALLFRREPLLLGLGRDLADPGDYLCDEHTGVPILVVRTASGELRAFVGLCRHRGAQLVSGSGKSNGRFTCAYHGWTYDQGGRLVAQPCAEGFAGVPVESLCLRPLPVAERHGMIFVRPSGSEPIDVDAHLGGAQCEIAPLGLGRYTPFARCEMQRAMNWKLAVDTFLEAYHVPSLHRRTLGSRVLGAPAVWDAFGRSSRLVAVRHSLAELRHRPEDEWNLLQHSVVLYNLFPNAILIHQIDHVEIVAVYPGGDADTATIVFSLYTPEPAVSESARRHFQSNFDLLLQVTAEEDFAACERIQRGFRGGGDDAVVYGRNEPGLAHYHRMIKAALRV